MKNVVKSDPCKSNKIENANVPEMSSAFDYLPSSPRGESEQTRNSERVGGRPISVLTVLFVPFYFSGKIDAPAAHQLSSAHLRGVDAVEASNAARRRHVAVSAQTPTPSSPAVGAVLYLSL